MCIRDRDQRDQLLFDKIKQREVTRPSAVRKLGFPGDGSQNRCRKADDRIGAATHAHGAHAHPQHHHVGTQLLHGAVRPFLKHSWDGGIVPLPSPLVKSFPGFPRLFQNPRSISSGFRLNPHYLPLGSTARITSGSSPVLRTLWLWPWGQ